MQTQTKQLERLQAQDLTVIPELQRDYRPNRVKAWAKKGVDELKLGTLNVAEMVVEDQLVRHIENGQHRWMLFMDPASKVYDPARELDCLVETGLSFEEVAYRFRATQSESSRIPAFDDHRLGIVANDPIHLAMDRAMATVGLKFGTSASASTVAAVTASRRVVERGARSMDQSRQLASTPDEYGEALLVGTLSMLMDAYPSSGSERWSGEMIEGLGHIMTKNQDSLLDSASGIYRRDRARMVKKLGGRTPGWLKAVGLERQKGTGGSASRYRAVAAVVVDEFNARLHEDRRLTI